MKRICSLITTLILLVQVSLAQDAPKFSANLKAANQSIAPGGRTELLLEIKIAEPWHIYDPILLGTGLPTTIEITTSLPATVGAWRFPPPALGESVGQEYLEHSGQIRVVAPLTLDTGAVPGRPLRIDAKISALACKEMCLPVSASTALEIPVTRETGASANDELFKQAHEALSPTLAEAPSIKGSEVKISADKLEPGVDGELIAVIRVEKGMHLQDRNPGVEGLIPARLLIEKAAGLEFVEEKDQIWPKPHVRDLQHVGKVNEQAGEFKIRAPFKIVDEDFVTDQSGVRVLFQYQACDDAGQCLPPEMAAGVAYFDHASRITTGDSATTTDRSSETSAADTKTIPATIFSEEELSATVPEYTEAAWADGIPWRPWRPGLPEALSRAGYMVYVDFTATWCLTCQSNKKLVLETDGIRAKMRELRVVPLKADFTNRDPQMLIEIKKHGNPTVPMNLVYAAGTPETPGKLPTVLTASIVREALDDPSAFVNRTETNLLLILIAGFLGGLILNVMPCVLPIISIKILSFVQQAGEDPRRVFRLGLAFCAGIMVWFWFFALLSAQGNIPWQYPEVVIGLGSIIFVFSLNLMGVFELILPGAAAGKLDEFAGREGYLGAFLKGLLATLLGTACTAPLLAPAMGYALTQPWHVGFVIFTAAGAGMATPYLLLSAKPAWLKFLPKPGMWMVTFKQASGFVLLATAVWLLWILADQIDGKGVVWTVAFWGFLALAAWMMGKISPAWSGGGRLAMWTASIAVVLLGFYFCYFVMYEWTARTSV